MRKHIEKKPLDYILNDEDCPKPLELVEYKNLPLMYYANIICRVNQTLRNSNDTMDYGLSRFSIPHVMIMSYGVREYELLSKMIRLLGGRVVDVENPQSLSHIVFEGRKLTQEFLLSLPHTTFVVDCSWVLQSYYEQKFLNENFFSLKDSECERELSFNIQSLLWRKKKFKVKLSRHAIYICKSIYHKNEWLNKLITVMGGTLVSSPFNRPKRKKFIVIGDPNDQECRSLIWLKFSVFENIAPIYAMLKNLSYLSKKSHLLLE